MSDKNQAGVDRRSYGADARRLLLMRSAGILSTHSVDVAGYPFGSIVPYCVDTGGHPLLLISDLAQHTKNVNADCRASLTITETDQGDVQSRGRVTCIGDVLPVDTALVETARRYYRFFPEAVEYHQRLDFTFYRLQVVRVGYIGGFGGLHWIAADEFLSTNPLSAEIEASILDHMNEDHVSAMEKYCRSIDFDIPGGLSPRMVGVDAEGFHLRVGAQLLRFNFSKRAADSMAVRAELVALVKR